MLNSMVQIVDRLKSNFSDSITRTLKSLFQTKHLYQSELVNIDNTFDVELMLLKKDSLEKAKESFLLNAKSNWATEDTGSKQVGAPIDTRITFDIPDVKLYCSKCGGLEAFNSVSCEEFFSRGSSTSEIFSLTPGTTIQTFIFSFLCQSCKSVPETFMVRREGFKLILCGRSPIEYVEVPNVIPKAIKRFYSSAIVAHQSGETLAGLFLLRTLLEQWVVSKTEGATSADQAIELYMNSLPSDFTSRFPSFRAIYSELSGDIHSAKGSPELFESVKNRIIEHFDARRLFKL
jgi:hypothetical protein